MIVQKYYCDRCGKLLERICFRMNCADMEKQEDEWLLAGTSIRRPLELCDSCKQDFMRWLIRETDDDKD